MGKRGPPPKPPEQKRLEAARPPVEAAAAPSLPAAPSRPVGLSKAAGAVWDEVVPLLLELGTLAKTDRGVLQAYCMTLARAAQLDALAEKTPTVRRGKKGIVLHPAGIEARKLWPVVQKLATDMGLSYAARSRTPPPKKPDATDPVEQDLFGDAKPALKSLPGGKA